MYIVDNTPAPQTTQDRVKALMALGMDESLLLGEKDRPAWYYAMRKAQERGERYFITRTTVEGFRIWRKG